MNKIFLRIGIIGYPIITWILFFPIKINTKIESFMRSISTNEDALDRASAFWTIVAGLFTFIWWADISILIVNIICWWII